MTNEVLQTIPHRPPFLFVDEIVEVSEAGATCLRTMQPEEAFYEGHYPGNPITPGVLLCEAVFQTGAIFLGKQMEAAGEDMEGRTPVLSRIQDARFKHMVKPGDQLKITVSPKQTMGTFHFLKGAIRNQKGKTILTVDFVLTLVDAAAGGAA
ncbi:MAG: 3-hydroxyacyl-ACP dehydratase FabZ family protein [Verrucomicrobiota bacterium]